MPSSAYEDRYVNQGKTHWILASFVRYDKHFKYNETLLDSFFK